MSDNSSFSELFEGMEGFLADGDSPTIAGGGADREQAEIFEELLFGVSSEDSDIFSTETSDTTVEPCVWPQLLQHLQPPCGNQCAHLPTVSSYLFTTINGPQNVVFAVAKSSDNAFTQQTPSMGAVPLSGASSIVLNKPLKEFTPRACASNSNVVLCIPNRWNREIQDASRRAKISPQHSELSGLSTASNVASKRVLERCPPNIRPPASLAAKPLETDAHGSLLTKGLLCAMAQQLPSSIPSCSSYSTSLPNCSHRISSSLNDHQRLPQFIDQQQGCANFASIWASPCCPSSSSTHTSPYTHQQFTARSSMNELSTSQHVISVSPSHNQDKVVASLPANAWLDSIIAEARDEIDRERLKHANSDGALSSQMQTSTRKRLSESDTCDGYRCCTSQKRSRALSLSMPLVGASSTLIDSNKRFLLVPLDDADSNNKNEGVLVQFVGGADDSLQRADPIEDVDNLDHCEEVSIGNPSSLSSSPSSGDSSSVLGSSPRQEWGTVRRTRAISLAGMSNAEITDRKRQQNRAAAVRYRRKLKDKRHKEKLEVEILEKNIKKLKVEAELLEDQISKLREIIFQSVTDRASHSIPDGTGV